MRHIHRGLDPIPEHVSLLHPVGLDDQQPTPQATHRYHEHPIMRHIHTGAPRGPDASLKYGRLNVRTWQAWRIESLTTLVANCIAVVVVEGLLHLGGVEHEQPQPQAKARYHEHRIIRHIHKGAGSYSVNMPNDTMFMIPGCCLWLRLFIFQPSLVWKIECQDMASMASRAPSNPCVCCRRRISRLGHEHQPGVQCFSGTAKEGRSIRLKRNAAVTELPHCAAPRCPDQPASDKPGSGITFQ